MTFTHPPSAGKRVCVDFDGTILPWGGLTEKRTPFPGAAEAIRKLKDAGYEIVILTSRMSETWWEAEAEERGVSAHSFAQRNYDFIEETLAEYDIPYDRITAEKVPAEIYFDDKAVRVRHGFPLATAIRLFLKGYYS